MRYKDIECVYCNTVFTENDDAVACPECGSPHHRECWMKNGCCANSERHSEGFSWKFPEGKEPAVSLKKNEPQPIETDYRFKNGENAVICPFCGALNYGNDAICMKCRKPLAGHIGEAAVSPIPKAEENIPRDGEAVPKNNGFAPENGDVSSEKTEEFSSQYPPFEKDFRSDGYYGQENSGYSQGGYGNFNSEQLYEYYKRFGGLRPETEVFGIPAVEMAEYIGEKKSGKYIRKFVSMERFGKKFSVSISALLFGPLWYFYRKLYKEGLIYILAFLVISLFNTYCSLTEPVKDAYARMAPLYEQVMNGELDMAQFNKKVNEITESYTEEDFTEKDHIKIAVSEVLGVCNMLLTFGMSFFADHFYRKKVVKDIRSARTECHDMNSYMSALRKKGGVSVSGAVIAALLVGTVYIVSMIPIYVILLGAM